jgi:lysophospholipase L1-like esterase
MPAGLFEFYQDLSDLDAGRRVRPVTVLHLGDSHIALDDLTGAMRQKWQALFGDGGRGLAPGVPYRYYAPHSYAVRMEGGWTMTSSLRADAKGPFGMTGYRAEATSSDAVMVLTSPHDIGGIEIEAYGGPDGGSVMLTLGHAAALRLSTRAARAGPVFLNVPAANVHEVSLRLAGDGPVRLLGWSMFAGRAPDGEKRRPGVRYDSYGISGATLDVTGHWNDEVVEAEMARLTPDLIILGYGTNEGFNDSINVDAYRKRFEAFVMRLERLAPQASILSLGAFDGARRVKAGDTSSCGDGWRTPPKLGLLRDAQREVMERRGHAFFDGAAFMGGVCSMSHWVNSAPPLAWPDHVHLRPEGARRAGAAIWQWIMRAYPTRSCSAAR